MLPFTAIIEKSVTMLGYSICLFPSWIASYGNFLV